MAIITRGCSIMAEVVLGMGSNIGQRKRKIKQAVALLAKEVGTINKQSSYYETEPWGVTGQPLFLNQTITLGTDLPPQELLQAIKSIEKRLGRAASDRWIPRVIDIDILFYGSTVYHSINLSIPHPHLHERNFVLIPLLEIIPEFIHPELQLNIEELYIRCLDQKEVVIHSRI